MQTSYLIYKYDLCGIAMYSTEWSTSPINQGCLHVQYTVQYTLWGASEALPSTIEISCTVHESRTSRSDQNTSETEKLNIMVSSDKSWGIFVQWHYHKQSITITAMLMSMLNLIMHLQLLFLRLQYVPALQPYISKPNLVTFLYQSSCLPKISRRSPFSESPPYLLYSIPDIML